MTLQEQLNANLVRLDESNKFLREQKYEANGAKIVKF